MTSAQVVKTLVNVISNSPSQDYTKPDDRTLLNDNKIIVSYVQIRIWSPLSFNIHLELCKLILYWIDVKVNN